MIKLIAVDLDGTLLCSGGRTVHERNVRALERAAACGVRVVVCTGRIFTAAVKYARLVPGDQPVICVNGAVVRTSRSLAYMRRVSMPSQTARAVLGLLHECGANIWLYSGDLCWAERESPALDKMRLRTDVEVRFAPRLDELEPLRAEKIFCMQTPEETVRLRALAAERLGVSVYVTLPLPEYLEILSPEATKGKALTLLAAELGVAKEEIAAFGDGLNDMELFDAAGLTVAMGNAADELKARADLVAPTNNEGGVGQVVERILDEQS